MRRLVLPAVAPLVVFACSGSGEAPPGEGTPAADAATSPADAAGGADALADAAAETAADAGPPKKGDIEPAVAAIAAVFLGSCVPDDRSNRVLHRLYVRRGTALYDRFERAGIDCLATKTNGCAAVTECAGVTVTREACATGCEGDVATSCQGALRVRIDCAKLGMTCAMTTNGADCVEGAAVECDRDTYLSRCEGGRPTFCGGLAETEQLGLKCSDFGATCSPVITTSAGPQDGCRPVGPEYTGFGGYSSYREALHPYGLSCANGSTLNAVTNGKATKIDCPSQATGFTCQSAGSSAFCGFATQCTTNLDESLERSKPTCEGDKLVICNGGRIDKVDCTALGFTGCDAQYGVCVPGP